MDTNVPVAANGRDTHASEACQAACIHAILDIRSHRIMILDEQGEIVREYQDNLNFRGEPGVGDSFFKYVHDYRYSTPGIRLVPITKIDDDERGYGELPINSLDPSDRKFLAAAVVTKAPIMNATDSDWQEQQALLDRLSVAVEQLCGHALTQTEGA